MQKMRCDIIKGIMISVLVLGWHSFVCATDLASRISVSQVTVNSVKAGVSDNWRVWGTSSFTVAPVFTVPLANGQTLVGFTSNESGTITARAARLAANDTLVEVMTLASSLELRGLAAAPDMSFAALLWSDANDTIHIQRFNAQGTAVGSPTFLTNPAGTGFATPNYPDDFNIGDSRLEYGGGTYGAYYHVHSQSGHEGDTLKWVNAATGAESTQWTWGCSHSMSNVLRYSSVAADFLPVCVTDCYPGTPGDLPTTSRGGIYFDNSTKVLDIDGACTGRVAGELGSAGLTSNGWALVFNAHQNPMTPGENSYDPATMNQDIGFVTITSSGTVGSVQWLTSTSGTNEADSSIARWEPAGDSTEQYVIGWFEPSATYKLARVNASGTILEGPVNVSALVKWGQRDDPFRQHANHDIVWAWFDSAGSTTLKFARITAAVENNSYILWTR